MNIEELKKNLEFAKKKIQLIIETDKKLEEKIDKILVIGKQENKER